MVVIDVSELFHRHVLEIGFVFVSLFFIDFCIRLHVLVIKKTFQTNIKVALSAFVTLEFRLLVVVHDVGERVQAPAHRQFGVVESLEPLLELWRSRMAGPLRAIVDDVSVKRFIMEIKLHDPVKNRWITRAQGANPAEEVKLLLVGGVAARLVDTPKDEVVGDDVGLLTHGAPRDEVLGQVFDVGPVLAHDLVAFWTSDREEAVLVRDLRLFLLDLVFQEILKFHREADLGCQFFSPLLLVVFLFLLLVSVLVWDVSSGLVIFLLGGKLLSLDLESFAEILNLVTDRPISNQDVPGILQPVGTWSLLQGWIVINPLRLNRTLKFRVLPDFLVEVTQVDVEFHFFVVGCGTWLVRLDHSVGSLYGRLIKHGIVERRSIEEFSICLCALQRFFGQLFLSEFELLLPGDLRLLLQLFLLLLALQCFGVFFVLEWSFLNESASMATILRLIKLFLEYLVEAERILVRLRHLLHVLQTLKVLEVLVLTVSIRWHDILQVLADLEFVY